jgi:two-component system, NarL family, response regulator NreC
VLVLDLNMPGGSSLEAIPAIREEAPETHVVVLTMQKEPAFAREALSAGALGYVLKEAADDELVEAVRRAAAGETHAHSGCTSISDDGRQARTWRIVEGDGKVI